MKKYIFSRAFTAIFSLAVMSILLFFVFGEYYYPEKNIFTEGSIKVQSAKAPFDIVPVNEEDEKIVREWILTPRRNKSPKKETNILPQIYVSLGSSEIGVTIFHDLTVEMYPFFAKGALLQSFKVTSKDLKLTKQVFEIIGKY